MNFEALKPFIIPLIIVGIGLLFIIVPLTKKLFNKRKHINSSIKGRTTHTEVIGGKGRVFRSDVHMKCRDCGKERTVSLHY